MSNRAEIKFPASNFELNSNLLEFQLNLAHFNRINKSNQMSSSILIFISNWARTQHNFQIENELKQLSLKLSMRIELTLIG